MRQNVYVFIRKCVSVDRFFDSFSYLTFNYLIKLYSHLSFLSGLPIIFMVLGGIEIV